MPTSIGLFYLSANFFPIEFRETYEQKMHEYHIGNFTKLQTLHF